jgi:hypothetical protein
VVFKLPIKLPDRIPDFTLRRRGAWQQVAPAAAPGSSPASTWPSAHDPREPLEPLIGKRFAIRILDAG